MKRILQIYVLILVVQEATWAQYSMIGTDAYSRANTLVAVPSYASVYQNPAGISGVTYSFLSTSFFKVLPVEGLQTVGIGAVLKNKIMDLGFSADSFGDKYFRESRLGLALAKKADKVAIGVKMSYLGTHIEDMSAKSTILAEAGMIVTPSSFLSLGMHVINLTRSRLYGDLVLPTIISTGAAIYPNKKVCISTQIDYDLKNKPQVRLGLNYQIKEPFAIATGINKELKTVHFGVSFLPKKYGLIYGVATHPYVGLAHHFTLLYQWND